MKFNENHTIRERSESNQEHVRKSQENKKKYVFETDHLHLNKLQKCSHVWGNTFWGSGTRQKKKESMNIIGNQ